MNILLINPPAEKIIEQGDAPNRPHLGLAYIGAWLIQEGFQLKAIDARYERLSQQEVLDKTIKYEPDIVGITAMTNMIYDAHSMAEKVKKHFPKVITVIGGPHAIALLNKRSTNSPFLIYLLLAKGRLHLQNWLS